MGSRTEPEATVVAFALVSGAAGGKVQGSLCSSRQLRDGAAADLQQGDLG